MSRLGGAFHGKVVVVQHLRDGADDEGIDEERRSSRDGERVREVREVAVGALEQQRHDRAHDGRHHAHVAQRDAQALLEAGEVRDDELADEHLGELADELRLHQKRDAEDDGNEPHAVRVEAQATVEHAVEVDHEGDHSADHEQRKRLFLHAAARRRRCALQAIEVGDAWGLCRFGLAHRFWWSPSPKSGVPKGAASFGVLTGEKLNGLCVWMDAIQVYLLISQKPPASRCGICNAHCALAACRAACSAEVSTKRVRSGKKGYYVEPWLTNETIEALTAGTRVGEALPFGAA